MYQDELPTVHPREAEIERVARDISAWAGELADETERGRRLPDELVARLRACGLLNAGAPFEVGGLELAPGLALRCAEEIARGRCVGRLVRVDRDHEQPPCRLSAG